MEEIKLHRSWGRTSGAARLSPQQFQAELNLPGSSRRGGDDPGGGGWFPGRRVQT